MNVKRNRQIRQAGPAQGFTLIELLVYMAILGLLFAMFYAIFDVNMKQARVQTNVADMQANLRVARHDISRFARMAGRGGLPVSFSPGAMLPDGVAVGVDNNVAPGTTVAAVPVVEGTDILTIRGVLFNPVYQIEADSTQFAAGVLNVNFLNPFGSQQDLTALSDAVQQILDTGENEAIVAVSPLGSRLYSPFEISGGATNDTNYSGEAYPSGVQLNFNWNNKYAGLIAGGAQPADMKSVAYIGVLEEYRYFIRAARAVPGDDTTALIPRLTRLRFDPGTDNIHPSYLNGGQVQPEDIADYILDLQVALGVDSNNDGTLTEGTTDADRRNDEWLFNHSGDILDTPGGDPALWSWNGPNRPLQFVRVNLLARTNRPDPKHNSPAIDRIEDHDYSEPTVPANQAEKEARMHRRRLSQSVVDLRNF